MSIVLILIIADLAFSAGAVCVRGINGTVRKYDMSDAFFGLLETGLIIWGVVALSGGAR